MNPTARINGVRWSLKWIAVVSVALAVTTAQGETFLVPSVSTPTIQSAVNLAAVAGDSILVGPGTYTEHVTISGKSLHLESTTGPQLTILHSPGTPAQPLMQIEGGDSTLVVTGFTFEGVVDSTVWGAALRIADSYARVEGNVFKDNLAYYGGAIRITGEFHAPHIVDNVFQNNTALRYAGAIQVAAAAPVIERNLFQGNRDGVQVIGRGAVVIWFTLGTPFIDPVPTLTQNLFVDNEGGYGGAIGVIQSGEAIIQSNTLIRNRSDRAEPMRTSGIYVDNSPAATVIRNNLIVMGVNGWGIYSGSAGTVIQCNDIWQNEVGNVGGAAVAMGFSVDPRLCDPWGSSGTLGVNSPCLPESTGCGLIGSQGIGCGPVTGVRDASRQVAPLHLVVSQGRLRATGEAWDTCPRGLLRLLDVRGRSVANLPIDSDGVRLAEFGALKSSIYFARLELDCDSAVAVTKVKLP